MSRKHQESNFMGEYQATFDSKYLSFLHSWVVMCIYILCYKELWSDLSV